MTATLSTRDGLLAAICENPAEDAPRLVYADLLDETGEAERAEFIRVQIELAGLNPSREDHDWDLYARAAGIKYKCLATCEKCSRERLQARETEILGAHPGWFPESMIPCFSGDGRISVDGKPNGFGPPIFFRFARGFVSEVRATLSVLTTHLPAIVRAHPVTRVEVTDRKADEDPATGPGRGARFAWHSPFGNEADDLASSGAYLPYSLFRLLASMTTSPTDASNLGVAIYTSRADADADLSAAAIAWARAA